MDHLNQDVIAEKFNRMNEIWQLNDRWHWYTHKKINKYIKNFIYNSNIDKNNLILNAGSGGNDYGLEAYNILHVDIAKEKIKKYPKYILSSVEKIPVESNSFDICICVGSVINYCSPESSLTELQRVLKPGGCLILEFEKTNSLELIGSKYFNKSAIIVPTFYNRKPEKLWMYDEKYIFEVLERNKFRSINFERFHIISPLIYKLCKNENFASYFASIDFVFKFIPMLKKFSSNIILTCKKET